MSHFRLSFPFAPSIFSQSGSTLHAQLEIWKMAYADQPGHQQQQTELWPASYAMPNLDLDYNEDSEGESFLASKAKMICNKKK